jgi:hypothetical protein
LDTMKKTEAGNDLANYLATHLDSDMNDPALGPMMQKYWESLGNTGPVPPDWAAQQVKAARDVRVNTEIGAMNYQIDELVASGQMKPEDAALLKDFNSGGMTQFLVRDPATGKVKFDATAYLASVSGGTSGGTVAPGTSTIKGVNVTTPEGKEEGDIFEKDGKVYRVDMDGNPEAVAMKDLTWDDIKGQGLTTDSAAYKAVVKNAEPMDLQYKSSILTDSWKIAPEVGETRRATVGGKDVLLKVTFKGTQDVKMGFDNAYIEFEDLDGNKYYAGGPTKSTEIKAGTARGTTNGNIVNAAIGFTPTGNKIVDTTINTVIPGRGIISAGKKIWDWMT